VARHVFGDRHGGNFLRVGLGLGDEAFDLGRRHAAANILGRVKDLVRIGVHAQVAAIGAPCLAGHLDLALLYDDIRQHP